MTAADLTRITIHGMKRFVTRGGRLGESRRGGRTAVIVKSKLQYGLGRMAEVFGEFEHLPFAFGVFRERGEAVAWLQAEPSSHPADTSDRR